MNEGVTLLTPGAAAAGTDPAALAWDPTQLSQPIKFWLYPGTQAAHPDVTVVGGDATAVVDHAGGAATLTGTTVAFDGTTSPLNGRAYLKHRYASRSSQLAGTGIGINGTQAWSMCCAVRFVTAPSTGDDAASLMIIGPTSSGASASQYIGTVKTGSLLQIAAVSGINITYPFGTEVLADGTPGTTLPSIQILGAVWDGSFIWLYLDGVLINTTKTNTTTFGSGCYNSQGNSYASNIPNASGNFGFYPWFFTKTSPDYDIFEALWMGGACSSLEMALLADYMIRGLAIPKTARAIVFVGDSYCEGTGASDGGGTVTKYVSCIPSTGADVWGSTGTDFPHWTAQMIAQAGTPITTHNRGHAGGYATQVEVNRPGYTAFELANVYAPRRIITQPVGLLELIVNDIFLAKTEPQWQAGLEYFAAVMRSAGYSQILRASGIDQRYVTTAPPDIEGGSISTSYTTRRTWNDWLRANFKTSGIAKILIDLEDMANSYVVPAALGGVGVWAATTAYKLGDRVLAPNGLTYQYEAAGTSGNSAPTATGTGIADGNTTVFAVDTNPARQTSHAYKIADRITVGGAGGVTWQCFVTPTSGGTGNSGTGPDPSGTADFVDGQITWRRVGAPNTLGSWLAELERPSAHTTNGTDLHYRAFGYKVVGMAVSRAIRLDLGLP